MSATWSPIGEAAGGIKAGQIRDARAEALRTRRRLVEVLEEQLELPQEEFLAALAATFFYPVVSMHEVNALEPVFDLLSYGEAVKHGCIALRDPAGKIFLSPLSTNPSSCRNSAFRSREYSDRSAVSVNGRMYFRTSPSAVFASSKRFISFSHFLSVTNGLGQIISTVFTFRLACISRKIKPASMVLPTPTPSAISSLGLSERMNFSTGRNW